MKPPNGNKTKNRRTMGLMLLAGCSLAIGGARAVSAKLVPKCIDAVYRDGVYYLGEVDQRGEFRAEGGSTRPRLLVSSGGSTSDEDRMPIRRTLNEQALQHASSGPVYEYRSGRLIPGVIDPDGYFVPDLGGGTIAVEAYDAAHDPRPIYNRPLPPIERVPVSGVNVGYRP